MAAVQPTEKDLEKLVGKGENALFEELGLRIEDMKNIGGYARSQAFAGEFRQDAKDQLGMEDLRKIGRKFWTKLEPQLIELICTNNPELGKITGGKSLPQVVSSLATAGLVAALAPPAWIIVAVAILVNKVSQAGVDSICEFWKEQGANKPATPA